MIAFHSTSKSKPFTSLMPSATGNLYLAYSSAYKQDRSIALHRGISYELIADRFIDGTYGFMLVNHAYRINNSKRMNKPADDEACNIKISRLHTSFMIKRSGWHYLTDSKQDDNLDCIRIRFADGGDFNLKCNGPILRILGSNPRQIIPLVYPNKFDAFFKVNNAK